MGKSSLAIKFSILLAGIGIFAFGAALLSVQRLPNKDEGLSNLSNMATTVGTLVATVALLVAAAGSVFAAEQLILNRKVAKHQHQLSFIEKLQQYNDIHIRLSPGGDWSADGKGPTTREEWNRVGRYLGLLTLIQDFIVDGIMDLNTADRCYSHRLARLMANKVIYDHELVKERAANADLAQLVDMLKSMPVYQHVSAGGDPA